MNVNRKGASLLSDKWVQVHENAEIMLKLCSNIYNYKDEDDKVGGACRTDEREEERI
jgi:hypothetical protein